MRRALALLLLLAACKVVPASPDDRAAAGTRDAAAGVLGDTTRIGAGESVAWDGGRLVVGFQAVDADSRCPADAMCVWAGDAAARFRLTAEGRAAGTVLHTNAEPKKVEYAGYVVTLVNVEPYPGTYDRSKPAPSPVAVVVVGKP